MNRKNIYYFVLFIFLLSGTVMPNTALGQNSTNLLDKMNQRLALDIPAPYADKLRDFVSNSKALNFNISAEYTESFIIKQMATDQGISKSNQYLFIWNEIYRVLTNDELYDGKDGNEKRLEEYETAFNFTLSCEKEYKENLIEVLEKDLQKSREDLQKSRENAIKTDKLVLEELANYYWTYKANPSLALDSEVQDVREIAKNIIKSCKKYDIDYRNHLLQYMKDEKEVEALIKFYGIE